MNTYIMIHLGMIEDQQNAGVLFSSPLMFATMELAIQHFVASLITAIHNQEHEDIMGDYNFEYVLDFFTRYIAYGVTDNIGYFSSTLEEYGWCFSSLNELLCDINSSPMILNVCGFESFLNPFELSDWYALSCGTEDFETYSIDDEYKKWIKEFFQQFSSIDYCI